MSLRTKTATTPSSAAAAAGADAHDISADASAVVTNPSCRRVTRRLNVSISGTMNNFGADGRSAAIWRPAQGQHLKIFSDASSDAEMGNAVRNLQTSWLVSARLLEVKNSFPVPLGVEVTGIPGMEHTEIGDRYTFTCLQGTHNPTPLTLFEAGADQSASIEWRKNFSEFTAENLETHQVLDIQNQNYVFVNENHPVVSLLKANEDLLGSGGLSDEKKIDGEWFKVSRNVLSTCCSTLRQKVLSKIRANNLNAFALQLHRLDAKEWADESDILDEHAAANNVSRPEILQRPFSFAARLELTYELQS